MELIFQLQRGWPLTESSISVFANLVERINGSAAKHFGSNQESGHTFLDTSDGHCFRWWQPVEIIHQASGTCMSRRQHSAILRAASHISAWVFDAQKETRMVLMAASSLKPMA